MRVFICIVALLLAACSTNKSPETRSQASSQASVANAALPEPGPEDGGLRLRLQVAPRADSGREGYDVRIDLLNVSQRPITLRAHWRTEEDAGDLKDYIEAATSIECVPEIAPWVGGVRQGQPKSQPQQELGPGQTLALHWQTDGRRLKNRVSDPNDVQNPTFPFPGLYSVHAMLELDTSQGAARLRSNEQLVPVGGSYAMPKYTRGPLLNVEPQKKTAVLGLGALHKIKVGDQFEIGHPKGMYWKLTITDVMPRHSVGNLELLTRSTYPPYSEPPAAFMPATLVARE